MPPDDHALLVGCLEGFVCDEMFLARSVEDVGGPPVLREKRDEMIKNVQVKGGCLFFSFQA